ncbi:hypothetical protein C8J57DRAFT_1731143, partial [Mycena rebaudengoi]
MSNNTNSKLCTSVQEDPLHLHNDPIRLIASYHQMLKRAAPLSTPCGTTHTGQPPTVSCKRWRHDPPYRPQHLPTVAFVTDTYIFGMRVSHGAHHAAQNTFRLSRPGRVDTAPAFLHFSTSSLGIAAFSRAAYPTPALIAPLSAPAPPQTVYTPCPHSVWARRTPTTARPTLQLPRIFPHRPVCVAAPHIRKTARRSPKSTHLLDATDIEVPPYDLPDGMRGGFSSPTLTSRSPLHPKLAPVLCLILVYWLSNHSPHSLQPFSRIGHEEDFEYELQIDSTSAEVPSRSTADASHAIDVPGAL